MKLRLTAGYLLAALPFASTPLAACAASAVTVGPQMIYDDAMRNGWQSGGWRSTSDLANTSPVHTQSRSIAVNTLAGWGAFAFGAAAPVNTTGLDSLTFWAHGGNAGGQVLQVIAFGSSQPLGDTGVSLPPLKAGQWLRVSVPLSSLNAANTSVAAFAIQPYSDTVTPTFYLDDIVLGPAPDAVVAASAVTATVATLPAPATGPVTPPSPQNLPLPSSLATNPLAPSGNTPATLPSLPPLTIGPMSGLHVSGNKLKNLFGQTVFLHGVNRGGTEAECTRGQDQIFASSGQSFVDQMKAWNINTVRIPLNEHCWLGINAGPANAAYVGAAYRKHVIDLVNLLTSSKNGFAVILDLHWSGPGTALAVGQQPMPDADHSSDFWSSVASTFALNDSVIFDLFNEPWPNFSYGPQSSAMAWQCWLNGGNSCSDPAIPYKTVGMQSLVSTVRATGAGNVIMLGGLQYSNELSQWLTYKPLDIRGNLAAAWHAYSPDNFCSNRACWDISIAPVMDQVPVITGEFGAKPNADGTCGTAALNDLWSFLEGKQQGYLAWVFRAWGGDCSQNFNWSLQASEDGTPTAYGAVYKAHLQGLSGTYP